MLFPPLRVESSAVVGPLLCYKIERHTQNRRAALACLPTACLLRQLPPRSRHRSVLVVAVRWRGGWGGGVRHKHRQHERRQPNRAESDRGGSPIPTTIVFTHIHTQTNTPMDSPLLLDLGDVGPLERSPEDPQGRERYIFCGLCICTCMSVAVVSWDGI